MDIVTIKNDIHIVVAPANNRTLLPNLSLATIVGIVNKKFMVPTDPVITNDVFSELKFEELFMTV